jgi:uncharacterized protein DUF6265
MLSTKRWLRLLPGLCLSAALFGSLTARADDLSKVTVQDLSFMAGKWLGQEGGFDLEEHWSTPAGNNLIGMMRMARDGKASMYELCVIEQTATGPVLRIRHFRAAMVPREEKPEEITFTLVDFAKDKATFEAQDKHLKISYHRLSANELTISLDRAGPDGKRSVVDFRYKLAK